MMIARFILVSLVSLAALNGCSKKSKSVADLYDFASTKDVTVEVNVDYLSTVNGQVNPTFAFTGKQFLLNAYALDGGGVQVAMGQNGEEPVNDLPVTLSANHVVFDVVMRLPITVQPGPTGYALRFQLKEVGAAGLALADVTNNLDALRGDVQAGAAASVNNVNLSIASSVAYRMVNVGSTDLNKKPILASYDQVVTLLKQRQGALENGLDNSITHDIASYVVAMKAALGFEIIKDKAFQSQVAMAILGGIQDGQTTDADKSTTAEKFAKAFVDTLVVIAGEVKASLADRAIDSGKVFAAGKIDTSAIPTAEGLQDGVFAPSLIAFKDVDAAATIGGSVNITPPLLNQGIASYNVYYGGEARANSKLALVGNVAASGDKVVSLSVPSGTITPSGATRFWVYPIAAGGELNVPASVAINNIAPDSVPAVNTAKPSNVTAVASLQQATVSWAIVAGASEYHLYWSTVSPVTTASNKIAPVTSPYVHTGLTIGQTYHYAVTAVVGGLEGPVSTEASAMVTGLTQVAITGTAELSGGYWVEQPSYGPPPATTTLTVTNNGTDAVNFASPTTSSLGLSGKFSVTGGTCTSATSLAAGQSCTLTVQFAQDTPGEVLTKTLSFAYTNSAVQNGVLALTLKGKTYCFLCRLFVTVSTFTGNLGGISGADAKCMADSNHPDTTSPKGVFKALTVDGTMRSGTVGAQVAWPLAPSRSYYRRPSAVPTSAVLATDTNSVTTGTWDHAPGDEISGPIRSVNLWTGIVNTASTWGSSPNHCNGWTSNSSAVSGGTGNSEGTPGMQSSDYAAAYLTTGTSPCNTSKALICVEQ